ncbi:MAG: hypothetical protein M3P96_10530, partial [Actinomycetota bacterium]|nr:hypothetical protein [Actinomycetota bacterium]
MDRRRLAARLAPSVLLVGAALLPGASGAAAVQLRPIPGPAAVPAPAATPAPALPNAPGPALAPAPAHP